MITVSSKKMYQARCVSVIKHNDRIFERARKIFSEYVADERKQIWVKNADGELIYALEYHEDRLYDDSRMGILFDRFKDVDLLRDFETLDLDLIERNELFVFQQIEEYTYLIADMIINRFPQKRIVFLDKNASLFFEHKAIEICDSIYDAVRSGVPYVVITSEHRSEQGFVPDAISQVFNSINMLYNLIWCSKVAHLGPLNEDKTIFLLDYSTGSGGLGDIMRFTCTYLLIAEEKGWVPVVDLSKMPNQYLEHKGDNVWNYFFEPVSEVTVEDARCSANVIVASVNGIELCEWRLNLLQRKYDVFLSKNCGKKTLFCKKVRLSCETQRYIEENIPSALTEDANSVLGVIARGSDYRKTASEKLGRTRCSASIESIIDRTDELVQRCGYDYVFLATEDEQYFKLMENRFGDRLLYVDQKRVCYDYEKNNYLEIADILHMENGKEFGRKYLLILYCLSMCDGLISSINCGASFVARSWNNGKYEINENIEELY